jgi:DNA helicase INO80
VLLSDSSSDEDEVVTEDDLQDMLRLHKLQKKCQTQFQTDPELHQYAYYSVGLLSSFDKFYEHQKLVVGPKKKAQKEQLRNEKRLLKG